MSIPKNGFRTVLSLFLLTSIGAVVGCSPRSKTDEPISHGSNSSNIYPKETRRSSSETKTVSGTVISVIDGDTIEILDESHTTHRIRLKGIDAPEKRQAFGNVARENLALRVAGKMVSIEWDKLDRNKRIVGKVYFDGNDVCLEQIRAGLAWHFKRFAREQSVMDRQTYADAENEARLNKIGLWVDPSQVPPWDFR